MKAFIPKASCPVLPPKAASARMVRRGGQGGVARGRREGKDCQGVTMPCLWGKGRSGADDPNRVFVVAEKLCMSPRQFHRKIVAITGDSPAA